MVRRDRRDRPAATSGATSRSSRSPTGRSSPSPTRRSSARLRERIADAFPDHGVVGEEFGTEAGRRRRTRWYIDPIDGTHNYIRGVPIFGDAPGGRARRRAAGRGDLRARARRALVGWRGGGAWAADRRRDRPAADPRVAASPTSPTPRCCTPAAREIDRVRVAPGLRRLLDARLARARLRRLLELHAGRRGRRRGDGRGRAVKPWDAAAPIAPRRGGRRPGHRLRWPPIDRFEARSSPRTDGCMAPSSNDCVRGEREERLMQEATPTVPLEVPVRDPAATARSHHTADEVAGPLSESPGTPDPLDRALEPALGRSLAYNEAFSRAACSSRSCPRPSS